MTEETETIKTLSQKIDELYEKLSKRYCEGIITTEENIKKHPLPYLTGMLVGGVIIGHLITRKRTK